MKSYILLFLAVLLVGSISDINAAEQDRSIIVECPHCKGQKLLIAIHDSYSNTFETQWLDCYKPFNCSYIQKCPACGQYIFMSQMNILGRSNGYEGVSGRLPYKELKEAADELLPTADEVDERKLRLELLWAYNNLYMTPCCETPTNEEKEYIRQNVEQLLRLSAGRKFRLFRAELMRETGRFDECIRQLRFHCCLFSPYKRFVRRLIMQHALLNDTCVVGWVDLGNGKFAPEEVDYGYFIQVFGRDHHLNARRPIIAFDELPLAEDDNNFIEANIN